MGSKGMDKARGFGKSTLDAFTTVPGGGVTFADPALSGPRMKAQALQEAKDADWMMRNRSRWHLMDRKEED